MPPDADTTQEERNMALINRISRLFAADVHAVLDRIEEPQSLLRQAIREMEEALGRSTRQLHESERELAVLERRREQIEAALPELDEQLDVCFGADNMELARNVVKRKLQAQRIAKHLAERRRTVEEQLADGRKQLEQQRAQLASTKEKAELFAEDARERAASAEAPDAWRGGEIFVGDDEVETALLREQQRRAPA
jgi:phage shock protein A